ncbi:MAG: hypothetical protein JKY22_12055 [Flavobacteriaceae bacterium]|nr:hypothetical protein [Flavobacteriaceae bacterium]PCJ26483.1 MAG: hypothetical protein COA94_05080 [Rickettsiales bacterium]
MNELELQKRKRLKSDFAFYARNCLFIRTKDKGLKPLQLNKAQLFIHQKLEEQKDTTGKVRAIILKGRQQGASTYIEGRFMWRTTHEKGVRAYILTHEDDASQNLFNMAKRYFEHLPKFVKPSTSAANAKELLFNLLDSGYQIGTAGNKSVGRSQTNQYFHGSEVAFWPNASEHAKGILQTVPDADGTEVIYESTANGVGNFFHQQWKAAERGENDFIPVFVPWFWQEEYSKTPPKEFRATVEESELAEQYDITTDQIYWRRTKIADLSADGTDGERSFKQEYPMNAAEAFQLSGESGLIGADNVVKARKSEVNGNGSYIVGVDPSRGGDRFSIIKRQGRKAYDAKSWTGEAVNSLGKAVQKCKKVLDTACPTANKKPDMMFIDAGGGSDLVDRLHELGYDNVKAVAFGSSPLDADKYKNKRGEMWGEMNLWLADENLDVEIPDDDEIQADLCASPYDRDSMDRIVLWKKEKIKKEYGFSPDIGDALALTFAEPVSQGSKLSIPVSSGGWMNA